MENQTMDIKVGTKIIGNWGAMISESYGEVIKCNRYPDVFKESPDQVEFVIAWDCGATHTVMESKIRHDYLTSHIYCPSKPLSGIGIYTNPF